ncbi:MAG: DEAD/DEAH box helicase [Firmicutes bacterium]|nr:DEAD/DEAH box helicase [Bacillota bacterium]
MLALRPYQVAALAALDRDRAAGYRRLLLQAATGAGKTILFSHLIARERVPTLFLAHREELLDQMMAKLRMVWPEAPVGLVQGDRGQDWDAPIVAASVDTLARRLDRADPARFRLAIVDESHRSVAASYRQVLQAWGFWPETPPDKFLLGVTATPIRTDGVGLGAIYERLSFQIGLLDLIRAGYLADLRARRITTGISLARVRTGRDGDFDEAELALAVDTPERNRLVAAAYARYGEGRKALGFAVTVEHARHLAAAFQAAGIAADWVAGSLPARERARRLQAFRDGRTQVLWNAQLLVEGYDEPSIRCIILARPTKSPIFYAQAIGRGTRLAPGKTDCLVLDVADVALHHDLQNLGTLLGLPLEAVERTSARRAALAAGPGERPVAPAVTGELHAAVVDLFARSAFRWRKEGRRWVLPLAPREWLVLTPTGGDRYAVWRRTPDGDVRVADGLTLDYAMGVAEDQVRAAPLARKDAAWLGEPASAKQRALAAALGVTLPDGATKADAEALLGPALRQRALEDPEAPWRRRPAEAYPRLCAFRDRLGLPAIPGETAGALSDRIQARTRRRTSHR